MFNKKWLTIATSANAKAQITANLRSQEINKKRTEVLDEFKTI